MDVPAMLRDAWDIAGIADRYAQFLDRWNGPGSRAGGALATQLVLVTEWLEVIRQDPRLPLEHLPADWPARRRSVCSARCTTSSTRSPGWKPENASICGPQTWRCTNLRQNIDGSRVLN